MRFLMIIIASILVAMKIQKILCEDMMMKNYYEGEMEPIQETRMKKPFCNAFTGCGRKRADDSLGSLGLFDFNTEQGLRNFDRQIPVNVRLPMWIALQNARPSKKTNDWQALSRQFEHPFFNYRRKRCGSNNYQC